MSNKIGLTAILVCVVSCALATFHGQFGGVRGSMDVWDLDNAGNASNYLYYSDWALADLVSITSDNRTFELSPNVSQYENAASDTELAAWRNDDDGNRWMRASTLWERTMDGRESGASFTFSMDEWNDLDTRYTARAYIQVLDPDSDYSVMNNQRSEVQLTGDSGTDITLSLDFGNSTYSNKILQAGFSMDGLNANPSTNWGSVTVTANELMVQIPDDVPPTPSPMLFFSPPTAISDVSISMTASNATDNAYGVEYYFDCVSGPGNDSDWQSSPVYVDSPVESGSVYEYRVIVRDTSPANNIAVPSEALSVSTPGIDVTPPSPNPMQIASNTVNSSSSVTLHAVTATDASSIQYKFTSVSEGASDSEWQDSPVFSVYNLLPGTAYDYQVQARDLSAATNMTDQSAVVSVVTDPIIPAVRVIPNGDFEAGGDRWTNYEPGGVTLSYEGSGGSGDGGGYVRHGRDPGTSWAVMVSPTSGGIPLSDLRVQAGETVTFSMDHKTIVGDNAPALKVEFLNSSGIKFSDSGDQWGVYSSDWTTLTFNWDIPTNAASIKFVPVAGAPYGSEGSVYGYDNIGIVPALISQPDISIASSDGSGTIEISCEGVAGQQYIVQYKEFLTDDGWYTEQTVDATDDGVIGMTLTNGWNQVFYRIIAQ